jgi:tetratricopeptide (TPR) repeat protein
MDRIEALKSMLAQDPNSVFARYGLAMEYVNSGRSEEAVEEFRELLAAHPDYAAAYYHAGRTLEKLGREDEARKVYEKGIEVTTRTGDAHTRSEIQAALDMVGL